MTPRLFLLITAAAISTAGFAQTPHLQPSAPRTLVITDAAASPCGPRRPAPIDTV